MSPASHLPPVPMSQPPVIPHPSQQDVTSTSLDVIPRPHPHLVSEDAELS
jgi:hypothetical protein